jgi:hypothetical protein
MMVNQYQAAQACGLCRDLDSRTFMVLSGGLMWAMWADVG